MSRLALLAAVLLLAGCQTTARYSAKGEKDTYGYSSESMSARHFAVTFQGDSTTDFAAARDFALLRAAELTREAGGTHFKVLAERNRIQRDAHAMANPLPEDRGIGYTGPVTGGSPVVVPRDYPAVWLEVEICPPPPPASPPQTKVYNAAETQDALVKKYRLNHGT
jgi:hypothetical protein